MPYYMEASEGQFCVYKEGEIDPLQCYESQARAEDYLTALNIATADEGQKSFLPSLSSQKNTALQSQIGEKKFLPSLSNADFEAIKAPFTPPADVADNARRALEVRAEKPPSQRGMTAVGLARARQLANRQPVSLDTMRRMVSYFERHEVDKAGSTWDEQGKGWQAWMGWGGDEGRTWANRILQQETKMETQEEYKASRRHSEADMKLIRQARKAAKSIASYMQDLGDDGMEMDEEPKAVKAIEEMGEFNTRQRMMVSSLVEVTHDAGKFDQGVGANGAHYMPAAKNPFASQGIACEYCFFYQPDGQCAIVEGVVEEYGVCKLWIIPEAVITMETMEVEDPVEEMAEEMMEDMDEEVAMAHEDDEEMAKSVRKPLDNSDTIKVEAVKFARRLLGRD